MLSGRSIGPRSNSRAEPEDVLDNALVELVLAVNAPGVDAEKDGDAVSSVLRDLAGAMRPPD